MDEVHKLYTYVVIFSSLLIKIALEIKIVLL